MILLFSAEAGKPAAPGTWFECSCAYCTRGTPREGSRGEVTLGVGRAGKQWKKFEWEGRKGVAMCSVGQGESQASKGPALGSKEVFRITKGNGRKIGHGVVSWQTYSRADEQGFMFISCVEKGDEWQLPKLIRKLLTLSISYSKFKPIFSQ